MTDRQYGRGGRLERANGNEYRYDGHGNLVEKILSDGASWKYLWTPTGRLAEVVRPDGKRVTFVYDALGRRVRKEFDGEVTEFVWDGDDLVHERVSKAGEVQLLVTWLFEPGTFAPVAKFEGRKRFSVVADHLGTPSMLMTEAGKLAWKAQLDVYGVPREEGGGIDADDATETPWRYPGQNEDKETGLHYNRFRYYDPESGQYISDDPIVILGGLHLRAYVHDSLGWIDPDGLIKQTGTTKSGMPRLSPQWRDAYGPGAMREHRLIPQEMLKDADFVNQMKAAGITDPKDYIDRQIARIPNAEHLNVHANNYNEQWKDWFTNNKNFTQEELQGEIRNAMKRNNISNSSRRGRRYGCK